MYSYHLISVKRLLKSFYLLCLVIGMFPSAEARNTNITLQDSVLQQPQDTFGSGLFEFVTEADNLYV